MTEWEYIAWLRRQDRKHPGTLVGPGDDCAVLAPFPRPWVATTDMLLEGSHFLLHEAGAYRVGRKALAVNLSDLAAMAAHPRAAVISVGLPRNGPAGLAEDLYQGMRELADAFEVDLVGGDTNSWTGPLVLSVTLWGETHPNGPVLRSGARPGDWIFVTGPLGGSLLGKHLEFVPRVQEAQVLHDVTTLHAMIDISDGLAADLNHLCEESGLGAVVEAGKVPIAAAAHHRQEGSPLEHALFDGEDFELLFAVPEEAGRELLADQPIPGTTLYHLGYFQAEKGMILARGERREPLPARGYTHEF